jgi:hypothetical protein
MGPCSACGTEIAVRFCPNCGGPPALTRRKANQALIKYSYAILAGLLGILIADHYFPLLDRHAFLIAGLCVFFAPVLFHLVSSVRKRLGLDLDRLRRAYLCAGAVAVFLALLMACNGAFDKSAATPVGTSVVYKQVVWGKSGPSYTVRVRSWRAERATEDLGVNARTYRSVSAEKGVVVEMHRGVFGLAWYSGVYSE